jgi:hypothetical protein
MSDVHVIFVSDEEVHAECGYGIEGHVLQEPDDGPSHYVCGFECENCDEITPMADRKKDRYGTYCLECWDEIQNEEIDYSDPYYEEMGYLPDGSRFANEGSALRAATPDNPRNLPCPTCGEPDLLTPADVRLDYQCDRCADAAERGY